MFSTLKYFFIQKYVFLFDRASWHTTPKIDLFANLKFLSLPPASPELNPVEQLWQQLRDNSLANRAYKNYFDIEAASCDAWNSYVKPKRAIASLCTRQWAKLDQQNLHC